jgi:PiT family inorganic phosphate transporter
MPNWFPLLVRTTPFAADQTFRVLQLGSAALYSIGHGANEAQKTMGIIAGLLFAEGVRSRWRSAR